MEIKTDIKKLETRWLQAGETRERFEREAAFAIQAYNSNGMLQKCTKESLLAAVFNVALTGLSLNPVLKYASLVPRWNSREKQYEASLEPQYQGLIKLALDSGKYKAITASVVYKGDEFDVDYANSKKVLKHIPYFINGQEQGEIRAAYCIAILEDGTEIGDIMTWPEIEAIRERSESYKAYKAGKIQNVIWNTDIGEMCKKTIVKRFIKYLDKGNEKLATAVELDNQAHGFRPFADLNQIQYLTQLIEEELIVDDNTLNSLRLRLNAIKFRDEADALHREIVDNYKQEDQNLSARAIGKKVDEAVKHENT